MLKNRHNMALLLIGLLLFLYSMCFSMTVVAEDDLNEIGEAVQTVQTQESIESAEPKESEELYNPLKENKAKNEESAEAVGKLFKSGGVDAESAEKAARWVQPVAKVINLGIAVILGIFSAMLIFISVLDIVYISVPPVRKWLMPQGAEIPATQTAGGAQGATIPGMGTPVGGYGNPYRQMGMGGMTGNQQGGLSTLAGRWISDDAVSAVREAGAGQNNMQGAVMAQQAPPAQTKNLVFTYLKKRAFSLVILGICLVLLTCSIFTDVGILLGIKILGLLSGIMV